MRKVPLFFLTLTLAACSIDSDYAVIGCDFRNSETTNINDKIRLTQAEMERDRTTRRQFTHSAETKRPYVLAIVPADGTTKADISSLDLPREAKMWLEMEVENRSFDGPLLGFLEANKVEWQPLAEGVSAQKLLYAWKQPGEELTVELTVVGGRRLITSLR